MSKLLYRPVGLLFSVLGGLAAGEWPGEWPGDTDKHDGR